MAQPTLVQKNYTATDCKAIDEEQRIVDHAISDDAEDRDGDDIALDAWDTTNYLRNPVVCESHSTQPAIGKCIAIYTQGNQLRAKTQFAPTDRGKMYYELYKGGYMNAFSVSFIPSEMKPKSNHGMHISKAELLEYSCVVIPANPRATKGLEDDPMEKSGAVLNKSNAEMIKQAMEQLKQASELLDKVLQSAEDEPPADNPPNPKDNPAPKDDQPEDVKSLLFEALKFDPQG